MFSYYSLVEKDGQIIFGELSSQRSVKEDLTFLPSF